MENIKLKNANFKVPMEKWEIFKKLCKLNNSDSSKELRKYVEKYIEENKDKLNKLF